VADRSYPADPAEAGLSLFQGWFGAHFARSTVVAESQSEEGVLRASLSVGRRWDVAVTLLNTLAPEATLPYEAERAAIERRLAAEGRALALWLPRGAALPAEEPFLSQFMVAAAAAQPIPDGRLEVRRPATLYLRRTSTTGSVLTILGGLSAHWAQFTNRVPGSFQLNSIDLSRLPASPEERDALTERIVLAAGQPDVDDTQVVRAEEAWTANDLGGGRSCVLGSPAVENDEQSATLRRNLRRLLKQAAPALREGAPAARVLVVLGASTYAEEEKLTWALRGMDPTLYAGYDIIAVLADGLVKPLLEPARGTLPWDAPVA
jgi:hypothetical protein